MSASTPCITAQWRLGDLPGGDLGRKDKAAARATFDVFQHTVDGRHYVSFQLESLVGSGAVAINSKGRVLGHGWSKVTLRVRPAFNTLGQCIGTGSSLQDDAEACSDMVSTCSNLTDLLRSNSALGQTLAAAAAAETTAAPPFIARARSGSPTRRESVAWVEDEFQFMARGDSGVADLQLESSSWGVGRPAGQGRSLLKSIPGLAAPTSRLAVAFLHDPCTVQWEVARPLTRPAFKLALVGQLGIASRVPLHRRLLSFAHPFQLQKHSLVSKAVWQAA